MQARRGFTLVEAIIAFVILLISIIVSFSVIAQVTKGMQLSSSHMSAANIAHGLLNQERALDFTAIAAASGTITMNGVRNGTAYAQQYAYSVDVEALDNDTRRVKATVTWNESGGMKSVVLQTIMTNL